MDKASAAAEPNMAGRVGNLTPKQEGVLKEFRENLKDILTEEDDDHELLRWLRARSFDIKKSEKMIRDNRIWRKEFGADTILDWEIPEVLKLYYPGGYFGHCKQGYPIFIDVLGKMDLKGMFQSVKAQDVFKFKVYYMEILYKQMFPELSKKFGKRIDQTQLIFDMQGIGMKHLWKPAIDAFTTILSIFEANYPECLLHCYVVNAPAIFPIAYNLCKPFLSEDTKKKIVVLKSDWKEKLLEKIDADQLPVHWGGTCRGEDGNEYCTEKVCMGGEIPRQYYAIEQGNFVNIASFTKATISKGSTLKVDCEAQAGEVIRWQFLSDGLDIGFGLYRRTEDGKQKKEDMEEILPTERVDSHIIPEDGSYSCTKPGTYVIRFDNTYSYIKSKKLSYFVEVLKPDESLSQSSSTAL